MAEEKTVASSGSDQVAVDLVNLKLFQTIVQGKLTLLANQLSKVEDDVKDLSDAWDSQVAETFNSTVKKRLSEISQENETISRNIKTFFEHLESSYRQTEDTVNKNADLFR